MILQRSYRLSTAVIVAKQQQHQITTGIAGGGSLLVARSPRPLSFPTLLLSLTPSRAARPMSSTPSPSPPPSERTKTEAAKEEKREGAASDPPAAAPTPLPPPPEMPEPGDCCGSGCVRCVWDVYYDELEAYNKLVAERGTETKRPD